MKELNYDYLQTTTAPQVRLPSDGVDPSRLNGPCRTYRLGRPMELPQLEEMPRDLQRAYLQRLRNSGASEESVRRMLHAAPEQLQMLQRRHRIVFDRPDPTVWSTFLRQ